MATERDFELLDDYISNRMDAGAKVSFERKLEADPDLQNEFSLQRHLVKGIANARKAQLKTMLNNTPVPASYTSGSISAGAKFALGGLVAAVVVTSVYLFTDSTETEQPEAKTEQSVPMPTEESSNKAEAVQGTSATKSEESAVSDEEQKEQRTQEKPSEPKASESPAPVKQPVLDVFDPTEESVESAASGDESVSTSGARPGSSMVTEVIRQHKNYNFHYQVKDGKLFLYGPFEKSMYEIMEFFSEEKRTIFLYHKDAYYLIEENSDKIRPLTAIQDAALINKLKEYRGN